MNMFNDLKQLHKSLCTAVASREWYWYNLASDYQSKYGFSSDYDKSFKRAYNEKAAVCRRTAEELQQMPFPKKPEDIPAFVASVKTTLAGVSNLVDQSKINHLIAKMEQLTAQGDPKR